MFSGGLVFVEIFRPQYGFPLKGRLRGACGTVESFVEFVDLCMRSIYFEIVTDRYTNILDRLNSKTYSTKLTRHVLHCVTTVPPSLLVGRANTAVAIN
jgi:hypothetical protein